MQNVLRVPRGTKYSQGNHEDLSSLTSLKPSKKGLLPKTIKRAFDIGASFILLSLLTPLILPVVSILIWLDSKGGVFYLQERTGEKMNVFTCLKFRTMKVVPPNSEISDEDRITRLGMFLRKTHIDELPQLVNVLTGEMSLVGPRPHMLVDTMDFESRMPNYHLRHAVKPGITGLAQISGYYGAVEDDEHLNQRVQLDIEYVYTWSILKDIHIMLQTMRIPFNDLK